MSRSTPWRRSCPDSVKTNIEHALEARFYIVRETGPTGFLVKQENQDATLKVFLGDPNSCTCQRFLKERDLCIHILWVLLRRFRIAKENPIAYQKSLVEREINEIIHGTHVSARIHAKSGAAPSFERGKEKLVAKIIDADDVCPICHEQLSNCKEPLTYCRYGCANNIHIKCMKIWAQHRNSDGETEIRCPLCRSQFGTYQDIIQEFHTLMAKQQFRIETTDSHLGAFCQCCKMSPIKGKCYRCAVCTDFHLCQNCFGNQIHLQHSFHFRKNTNQRWRPALRRNTSDRPLCVVKGLQARGLCSDEPAVLSSLERQNVGTSTIGRRIVEQRNDLELLLYRDDCQICNRTFDASRLTRRLACSHTFHRECLDDWIAQGHSTCPCDGERIRAGSQPRRNREKSFDKRVLKSCSVPDLSVFGTGSMQTSSANSSVMPIQINEMLQMPSSDVNRPKEDFTELGVDGILSSEPANIRNITLQSSCYRRQGRKLQNGNLPPLHPRRTQCRRKANPAVEPTSSMCNELKDSSLNLDYQFLTIGSVPSSTKSEKTNSTASRLLNGKYLMRKGQAGHRSISCSEPDLPALADAFSICPLATKFYDKNSK